MSAFTDLSVEILAKSLDKESWNQLEFVQTVFNDRTINEVALTPWAGGGGLNADSNILTIKRSTGATGDDAPDSGATEGEQRVFVKLTDAGRAPMSKAVGLSREGLVYGAIANHGSELLKSLIPRVYFGHGDMSTGRKVVVMELVDGVQAGYFYGAQSLHNWGKDLTNLLADYPAFDELAVTLQCFRRAADLHSAYWGKPEEACKDLPELRSADWMRGEGQESWNTVLEQARVGVELVRGDGASKLGITLNPDFMKVIEASFAKTTWESYQEMFAKIPKMLFHGDYHPSNIIVRRPTADQPKAEPNIVVVDLEVIGIGSGPQDLGQFHMSHNSPESRRKNTDVVLQAYLDRLTEKGVSTTLEHVKSEYVNGGFGRWMWLFPAILTMGLPAPALQFFHDQTWAFAQDHNITPENAPLVRP